MLIFEWIYFLLWDVKPLIDYNHLKNV